MPPLPPQPAVVDVTLTPGGFVNVVDTIAEPGFDRLCTATIRLRTPAPAGISQAASTATQPNPPLIVLAPMLIDFFMPFSVAHQYRLAGISFRRCVGSGPANGHSNLPKDKIFIKQDNNGTTISIKDLWVDHGKPGTPKWLGWEMYLFVQDSGGDIGIIDPDILNEE